MGRRMPLKITSCGASSFNAFLQNARLLTDPAEIDLESRSIFNKRELFVKIDLETRLNSASSSSNVPQCVELAKIGLVTRSIFNKRKLFA